MPDPALQSPPIDAPRLLHKDSSRGYTDEPHLALAEEPEAVPEEEQRHQTTEARNRFDVMRADERRRQEARSIGAQAKATINHAALRGVNVEDEIAALRAAIDAMRRKVEKAA